MFGVKRKVAQEIQNNHERVLEKIQSVRQLISAHKHSSNIELTHIRNENVKLKDINSKISARLDMLEKESSKGLFSKEKIPTHAKRSSIDLTSSEESPNPKLLL